MNKLKGKAGSDELQDLRNLHEELAVTGRLGDLPKQGKLASKAIAYCTKVIESAEATCTCEGERGEGDQRLPPRFLCPSCQRVLRILRAWLQMEALSVRRAAIEEKLFLDIVKAKLSLPDDSEGKILGFAGVVREYREHERPVATEVESKEVSVGA